MKVLRSQDYSVSLWSGGTTRQLAISPEDALYAGRDFNWRLSSATVDLEESDFTSLPDYNRLISLIQGEMHLWHNGEGPVDVAQFEVHRFDGADDTHCLGKCTDYNLMLRKGKWDGTAAQVHVRKGENRFLTKPEAAGPDPELLLFCVTGNCRIQNESGSHLLSAGETLRGTELSFRLTAEEDSVLMAAWVWPL